MPGHAAIDVSISMKIHGYLVDKLRGTWVHHAVNTVRSLKQRLMRRSDGERILLRRYVRVHGKQLNRTKPQTFSEKLYGRLISLNRGRHPEFTQLADKYAVRAYVARKIGEQYLVKLLWHGEAPNAIPFDSLPNEYVIKPNHGSGKIIVVKGKAERIDIINKVSVWMNSNYYWACREYQYYHIKPRIMIEEYLRNQDGSGPLDYRFWCFKGIPEVIQVDNPAHDINPFYDTQWNQLDLYYREGVSRPAIHKPSNFDQMMGIASDLAAGLDFVRVDLYNIEGKIYFGELTLTPTSGEFKLQPESWDLKLGAKWEVVSGI